jgi:streptomycin 6-kinase
VLKGYQNKVPVVLKLSIDSEGLEREAKALDIFKGFGAVSVLNRQKNSLLLQQAIPGYSLKGSSLNNIEIACKIAQKLHTAPLPKDVDFPLIDDWLVALDKDWGIPKEHLLKARKLKQDLLANLTGSPVLLHGDLHQDNILSHDEDWLVIDPKGVIGYSINELWACIEDPSYDLKFISEYFGYPFHQVVKWYYVHLILAACWQVEDNLDPSLFLKLAHEISLLMRPILDDVGN